MQAEAVRPDGRPALVIGWDDMHETSENMAAATLICGHLRDCGIEASMARIDVDGPDEPPQRQRIIQWLESFDGRVILVVADLLHRALDPFTVGWSPDAV